MSDAKLADWYARWPGMLPTSVPHEQVLMLIEDLRDCRRKLAAAEKMVAAQTVIIAGMVGAFEKEGL